MKKILILVLSAEIFFGFDSLVSEDPAEVSGTIFMPLVKKERRTFRGRLYRNRLSSASKAREPSPTLQSSFLDVIVSAHPLSFQPDAKPLEDVQILQRNATFIPRVVPITPGTNVQFINRDRFFHNVFSITPGAKFNIGRKPTGWVVSRKFDKLGEIKLFCDIHAQMNAAIICLETPYFTRVDANGRFSLNGLPAGAYELRIYHPDLEEITEVVQLRAGQSLTRNFSLNQ